MADTVIGQLVKGKYNNVSCSDMEIQWWPKVFGNLEFSPFNPILNNSCKIERYGNKMHQIVQNMILTQSLELKLSVL